MKQQVLKSNSKKKDKTKSVECGYNTHGMVTIFRDYYCYCYYYYYYYYYFIITIINIFHNKQ